MLHYKVPENMSHMLAMWKVPWDTHGTSALVPRQAHVKRPATAADICPRKPHQGADSSRDKMVARARRSESAEDSRAGCTTDIWHSLTKDLVEESIPCGTQEMKRRPSTARQHRHEYSSASGSVRITDVQLQGLLVRLGNSSQREQDIGGFRLQQNVAGRPIAEFLFPPRTLLQPASSVTVWSEASGRKTQSPWDFLWVGLERIMLRPECTTVLCKDNGQAIAWYTPARCTGIKPQKAWAEHHEKVESCREDTLSCEEASIPATEINCPDNTPFLLIKRKKHVFRVCHSPWTQNPSSITHPSCSPCALLDFRAQPQSNPARKHTAGVQARRPATLRSQGTGVGGGPVRSAGPCVGGMMFLGSQPPCTSLLQQYRTAAKLHSHNMVITA
ncbi:lamin tail domain-containing protein 1-like isoform X1 [Oncorhynchus tshawytscha]|uniref:LTD domain-containing protein n=1 Tax=Oncorhynchus tshawytscha TaxID=74940 RepID=A0AAZ3RR81_ONCTS|nr:lamin tail domain-containing protein 1-like isoform X1 [Oncorhynchus tshawytscha]